MRTALTEQVADEPLRDSLLQAFTQMADHMVNTDSRVQLRPRPPAPTTRNRMNKILLALCLACPLTALVSPIEVGQPLPVPTLQNSSMSRRGASHPTPNW